MAGEEQRGLPGGVGSTDDKYILVFISYCFCKGSAIINPGSGKVFDAWLLQLAGVDPRCDQQRMAAELGSIA